MVYLKCRKGVGGNVERGHLYVAEEIEEFVRVQHDLGQRLVASALAQHCAAVQGDLLVFVSKLHTNDACFSSSLVSIRTQRLM